MNLSSVGRCWPEALPAGKPQEAQGAPRSLEESEADSFRKPCYEPGKGIIKGAAELHQRNDSRYWKRRIMKLYVARLLYKGGHSPSLVRKITNKITNNSIHTSYITCAIIIYLKYLTKSKILLF
jgi:hypothetical protein